jgi:ABC-type dipeptide/oligopeptide/nickel transport system ATPase component/ABC-type dipeptide/oligopeptide/nickel transport system permease subunit
MPRSAKVRAGLIIVLVFILLAVFGPLLAQYAPDANSTAVMKPPSAEHWFGTTQSGSDVFSQFVNGARVSMLVGLIAAIFSKLFAIVVGIIGGYVRGLTDDALYILTSVFLVIPGLPLLIVLTAYIPSRGVVTIAIVIAITSWAGSARVLRAQTLSLRNRDFVEAARATGEPRWRIILAEIIPSELPLIASGFLFMVIGGILAEAGLSFLGLGNLTTVSWGSMLYFAESAQAFLYGAWWWFVPPGLAIAIIGAGLALINFGIDEYANPRLRTGRSRTRAARPGRTAAALNVTSAATVPSAVPTVDTGPEPADSTESADPTGRAARSAAWEAADPVIRPAPELDGSVILEISDLCVDYPTDHGVVRAVRDVSLSLRRGELLGLAGESGSGKSTLTNAVARLLKPPAQITGGTIDYHRPDGSVVDVLAMSAAQLRRFRWTELSVVFQSAMNALNPVLSIWAQFDDVLRVHRPQMTKADRLRLAREMLVKVGIDPDRVHSYPHELSGGMKQRVGIALALVLDPDVIIMDEPTTALDLLVQREVIEQVMGLREEFGFAIIFTTHDLALLLEICDSIAVMQSGRLVEYGSADDVLDGGAHPYTRSLMESLAKLGANL